MIGYLQMGPLRIFGAPIHINWLALVAIGVLLALSGGEAIPAVSSIFSYFGLILLHESGHAFVASRLGYQPQNIYLGLIHGTCEIPVTLNRKHRALVARGGSSLSFSLRFL